MKETKPFPTMIGVGAGIVVGLLWVVMAAAVIWTAVRGAQHGRSDWALGWGLVGFFLSAAALSALLGTWWHHARVRRSHH